MAGEFHILDWAQEVDTHKAYIEALEFITKFYKNNSGFRLDVARSTAKILAKAVTSSDGKIKTFKLFSVKETVAFSRTQELRQLACEIQKKKT